MLKYAAAYAATLIVMVALDMVWLGLVAKPMYQQGLGHLMAARPVIPVALLFYLVYALGLVIFGVNPGASGGWARAAAWGAVFGFFAYATYDLTNWATLKDWPWALSLIDMAWGAAVSAVSAVAGQAAWQRFGTG
jgi:uncharacterized membrane protein